MVGREVTPMRWWQNGSINAFTLSHKSGVLRLPPLTYTRTHRIQTVYILYVYIRGRWSDCMRARIYGRNETSKHHRFTVKALFEGSVYWLLNIDILLSGLRKEARCPPRIHLFNHTLHSFPPLSLSLSLSLSRSFVRSLAAYIHVHTAHICTRV